jgi:hypothetical protein
MKFIFALLVLATPIFAQAGYRCEGSFTGRCNGSNVDTRGKTGAIALVDKDGTCYAAFFEQTDLDAAVACASLLKQLSNSCTPTRCEYRCEGSFQGRCGGRDIDTRGKTGAMALVSQDGKTCFAPVQETTDLSALQECTRLLRTVCL